MVILKHGNDNNFILNQMLFYKINIQSLIINK